MKRHFIILIIFVSYFGYSQCEDSDKLDLGGTYLSRTKNYIRFAEKYKDSIYLKEISYPEDIKKIEKYSDFILKKAENYIIDRGGFEFYKSIKIHGFEVNYKDTIKVNLKDPNIYNLSNYNVTYWILYLYKNKNIKYAFGLEFDKNGEMISENKFPKYSDNINFENLTDYCLALNLIKKNKKFKNKKVDYIELSYLDISNSFCWLIEEVAKPNKEFEKWEEKSVNQYYINANTNKLESVVEKKFMSIASGVIISKRKIKKEIRKEKRLKRKQAKNKNTTANSGLAQ